MTRSNQATAALWALLLSAIGCQPADLASAPGRAPAAPERPATALAGAAPEELWDLMTIDGQQVGYQVTRFRDVPYAGQVYREVSAKSELTVRRFGQETRQAMDMVSLDTSAGQLVRFHSTLIGAGSTLQTTGVREGDLLRLTTTTDGKATSSSLPLPGPCGGLFAVENSLLKQPLQPGESRSLQMVVPVLNVVATVRLQAQQREEVELPTGRRDLLRIDSELQLANGQTIQSQMWADAGGQVLRSDIPALRQVAYRADRQTVERATRAPALDLGEFSLVRVDRPLADPHRTQRIRYRAQMAGGDPCRVFPSTSTQTVRRIDDRAAEIVVDAVPRQAAAGDSAVRPPEQRDLLPSAMIQSDDPAVQELRAAALLRRRIRPPWHGRSSVWSTKRFRRKISRRRLPRRPRWRGRGRVTARSMRC